MSMWSRQNPGQEKSKEGKFFTFLHCVFSDASPKASSSSAACQERAQGVDPQTGQLVQEEHHLEELDEVGEDNPVSEAGQF